MTTEQAYVVCKKPEVSEHEACEIIAHYIKLRKGMEVKVCPPVTELSIGHPSSELRYTQLVHMMFALYKIASDFILVYHDNPEAVTVKVYE